MIFFITFFRSLIEKDVQITIELKNGIKISGKVTFVDNNMNFNLSNVSSENDAKTPQFFYLKNCFIRGSTIRYIHVPPNEVDVEVLQEACKKELKQEKLK